MIQLGLVLPKICEFLNSCRLALSHYSRFTDKAVANTNWLIVIDRSVSALFKKWANPGFFLSTLDFSTLHKSMD